MALHTQTNIDKYTKLLRRQKGKYGSQAKMASIFYLKKRIIKKKNNIF